MDQQTFINKLTSRLIEITDGLVFHADVLERSGRLVGVIDEVHTPTDSWDEDFAEAMIGHSTPERLLGDLIEVDGVMTFKEHFSEEQIDELLSDLRPTMHHMPEGIRAVTATGTRLIYDYMVETQAA